MGPKPKLVDNSPAISVSDAVAEAVEKVVIEGDLSAMTPEQRVIYYRDTCSSLALNWRTKPFDYIRLNGKLTLYARRDCTDQLRSSKGVSITKLERERMDDLYVVTASAVDKHGRVDAATGAVSIGGLKGEMLANALMKAETKAKRRVTLSLCGLGLMDETEVSSVPDAQTEVVDAETGEIIAKPTKIDNKPIAQRVSKDTPLQAETRELMKARKSWVYDVSGIEVAEADRKTLWAKLVTGFGAVKDEDGYIHTSKPCADLHGCELLSPTDSLEAEAI